MKRRQITDGLPRRPGRIHLAKYEAMWDAYCENRTAEYVAAKAQVPTHVAAKYIERGDRRRGLMPLSTRYNDAMRLNLIKDADKLSQAMRIRRQQMSNMIESQYAELYDKTVNSMRNPSRTVSVPNYLNLVDRELELVKVEEAQLNLAALAAASAKVDFQDPHVKSILTQRMVAIQRNATISVARLLLNALDPERTNPSVPDSIRRLLETADPATDYIGELGEV